MSLLNDFLKVSGATAFWRAGGLPDRDNLFTRPNILVFYLVAAGLTSLSFYVLHPGYYNPNANWVLSVLLFAMLPLAWHERWYGPVVHGSTLINLALITYIATQTGGLNSTVVVWLNVLALPVLLLIGPRAALFWIVTVLATIALLFVAMKWVG